LDVYKIISLGLNKIGVVFLYTALRLNGVTYEYFDTIFI